MYCHILYNLNEVNMLHKHSTNISGWHLCHVKENHQQCILCKNWLMTLLNARSQVAVWIPCKVELITFSLCGFVVLLLYRDRMRAQRIWQKNYGKAMQDNRNRQHNQHKNRDASVRVQESWVVLEDMDFVRLQKLNLPTKIEGEDL